MDSQKLAHFGVGKAGRLWITYFSDIADVTDMIDPDPRSTSFANRHGAEFYRTVPQGSRDGLLPPLNNTDIPQREIWTISSPVYQRPDIINAGLAYQIPTIFTQRPLARTVEEIENIEELTKSYDGNISVNYEKNVSQVTKAILEDIPSNFTLDEAFHVSNQETKNIKPITRARLVDEFALLQKLFDETNTTFDPVVESAMVTKWNETDSFISSQLRDVYDYKSSVELSISDTDIRIEGEFGDIEMEQLLWTDETNSIGYFASFTDSDDLTPAVIKLTDWTDIEEVEEMLFDGDLDDDKSIEQLVQGMSGVRISVDSSEPLKTVFRQVYDGEITPASVADAATVEKLAKQVYDESKHSNMYQEEGDLIESGESVW